METFVWEIMYVSNVGKIQKKKKVLYEYTVYAHGR